jgi:hypothetical protein
MKKYIPFFLLLWGCYRQQPDEIPLPTRLCVKTQHHHQPIPGATVYVKYNTEAFPGYDRPASYFDAQFKTGANARGCLEPLPEGTHWIVAFGYDSLYFPHDVFGSMKVHISLKDQPKVDTLLYVSEE